MFHHKLKFAVFAGLAMTQSRPLSAQDASDVPAVTVLQEVIVTSQKRSESSQRVPLSVTAFDSNFVKQQSIATVGDIVAVTPGLNARVDAPSQSVFAIRGIGTNAFSVSADPSVGIFIDDVYAGHPIIANSSFFDVGRIEVVKGPQGTLFGRNTSAGAISIVSHAPDSGAIYLDTRVGFGSKNAQIYEAIGNFSPGPDWGIRAGARYEKHDGTFRNSTDGTQLNGKDDLNLRVSAVRRFTDRLDAKFVLDYSTIDSYWGATAVDTNDPERSAEVASVEQNGRGDQNGRTLRVALTLNYTINDELSLTATSGYLDARITATPGDFDLTTLRVLEFGEPNKFRYLSQELRLNGKSDAFDWFVGLSARDEHNSANTQISYSDYDVFAAFGLDCAVDGAGLCNDNVSEPSVAIAKNRSWGVFGDLTWKPTDRLKLTLGGRYSKDKKYISVDTPFSGSATAVVLLGGNDFIESWTVAPIHGDRKWSKFTPRFAVSFDLAKDVMLYGNVSRGYKGGGFNSAPNVPGSLLSPGESQFPNSFDPEQSTAVELGIKSFLLGRRLRVNAAFYNIDYSGYQVETQVGPTFSIQNVADATNRGVDLEAQLLLSENFEFGLGYAYLDSKIDRGTVVIPDIGPVDVTGNRMPFAPKSNVALTASYKFKVPVGRARLGLTYNYTDSQFISVLNDLLDNVQVTGSHYTLDLRATLSSTDDRVSVSIIGQNVTDQRWFGNPTFILEPLGTPNIGRLWRAELAYRF